MAEKSVVDSVESGTAPTVDNPIVEVQKSFTVPCVEICLPGNACPHGGAEKCTYSHKRLCNYSIACKMLNDADHQSRFYHPLAMCRNGPQCQHPQSNHWASYAHPCFIRQCARPTVGYLNGWLCGYHYRRLTSRQHVESTKRPLGDNVSPTVTTSFHVFPALGGEVYPITAGAPPPLIPAATYHQFVPLDAPPPEPQEQAQPPPRVEQSSYAKIVSSNKFTSS